MKKIVSESGVGLDGDFEMSYGLFQDGGRVMFKYQQMSSEGSVYMEASFPLKEYRQAMKELEETGRCRLEEVRSLQIKRDDDGRINLSFRAGDTVFENSAPWYIKKMKV